MLRPVFYARWQANLAVIWPSLMVGIDDDGFICVELCWLGLSLGIGTVEVGE